MSEPISTYGITYTPASVTAGLPTLGSSSEQELAWVGIRYVRLQWNDFTNTTRSRVIPLDAFFKLLQSPRPGIGLTKAALGIVGLVMTPGFTAAGEYLYIPDMASMRTCHGYAPGHVSVMGWFEEKVPRKDENGGMTFKAPLCPRGLLKKTVDDARSVGVEFLVGIETEFILLKSTDPIEAVNDEAWSVSAALTTGSVEATVLEEIADSLKKSSVELLMYHAEAAPGQYEIVTGPMQPLEAADAVILTRETIYNIAAKHGLRATLAPRIYSNSTGSSAHANISLHRTSDSPENSPASNPNTNKDTTMTPLERSFLQSLLEHLPAVAAFTLPTRASYARVQDGVWSGGTWSCWGTENREALVRLSGSPGSHRFEVRSHDGTANPYIALAALLGTGMVGVRNGKELEVIECEGIANDLPAEERQKMGITGRMPRTLSEARELATHDQVVHEVLGEYFVDRFLAVNETLEKTLVAESPEAEMKRLIRTY
ncbi:hypothetical protein EWM64_g1875 [Hericium alpestre]|uniref:Glutamine synthetase n=1 Tax=Hericium alpestre TaxID=135208 RepID=A0A4Z0A6N2_9AGAM|nr:hypothetical protein EWM64_g1875 [Hericium alpestre]